MNDFFLFQISIKNSIRRRFLLAGLILITCTQLHAEILSNFSVGSDYLWRGKTQTNHQMSVQGGLDWDKQLDQNSGMNLGTWVTNARQSVEQDLYLNYKRRFNIYGHGFFFNYVFYHFPMSESHLNTHNLSVGLFSLWLDWELSYIPKYFGVKSASYYSSLRFHYDLIEETSIIIEVGKNFHDKNDLIGETDYVNFSAGLGKEYEDLYIQLNFANTNRKVLNSGHEQKVNDQAVYLNLSKFFY